MRIHHKFTATLIGASLVPMIFLGLIAYSNAELAIKKKTFTDIHTIADNYVEKINNYVARGGTEEGLWNIVSDNTGLGETGEIIIAKQTPEGEAKFLAASRFDENPSVLAAISMEEDQVPVIRAFQEEDGLYADLKDYRGIPVFASVRFLEETGWGLAVQIDQAEVLSPLYTIRITLTIMGAIVLAFSVLMAYITAQSIADPIQELQQAADELATGKLDSSLITVNRDDEIGDLANAFASMADELQELYSGLEKKVEERTKQLSNALQDVRKFQMAVEESTDAVLIAKPDLSVLYVNPMWEKLTGFTFAEVEGKRADILDLDNTDIGSLTQILDALKRGETYHSEEIVYKRKDNTSYNVETSIFPIKELGIPTMFVEIHNDITSRKREERAKSEFVSLASHQLRTPLTAIRWAIGRLQRSLAKKGLEPKEQSILDAAHKGAVNMAETIGTMLTISRLESGKLKLNPTDCNLSELLTDLQNVYQIQCEQEQKTLSITALKEFYIQTDPKLLREILSNLISNAIKYSPTGSQVQVTMEQLDPQSVTVYVRDAGYGIPKEQQDKVFSIFFRADNVLEKKVEGTGLGLYLVHSLTKFLGGHISFISEENVGTTFTLALPITPDTDE